MSNVIKAYSVCYDVEVKKTIGIPFTEEQKSEEKVIHTSSLLENPDQTEETGEFVEGLNAIVVETLPSQDEIKEQAAKIIEDATKEAMEIIDRAKGEAEQLKQETVVAAQKRGYEEGMEKSRSEALRLSAEWEEKTRKLQKEYEEMTHSLEPQMARIIAQLVERITGILVSDKEEVIIYLINRSMKNMDKSSEYTIRVSPEDLEYVSMKKEMIIEALGRDISLYISEDTALSKNQCLIETDLQVINCSLDVQLKNLITDLKIISGI